nr:hypothetical protein [Kordia antarctica]
MSISMAFVVLFATMSFVVNMHYCGDVLVDTAIFQNVKTCGMEMQNPSTEGCSMTQKDCCNDEQIVKDAQNELQLSVDKISFDQHIFITSFVYSYINLFESLNENTTSYQQYKPPVVVRQIYKIDEMYLI